MLQEPTGRRESILDVNGVARVSLLVDRVPSHTATAPFRSAPLDNTSTPPSTPAPSATLASISQRSNRRSAVHALPTPQQRELERCQRTSAPTDAGSARENLNSATGTRSVFSIRPTTRKWMMNGQSACKYMMKEGMFFYNDEIHIEMNICMFRKPKFQSIVTLMEGQ